MASTNQHRIHGPPQSLEKTPNRIPIPDSAIQHPQNNNGNPASAIEAEILFSGTDALVRETSHPEDHIEALPVQLATQHSKRPSQAHQNLPRQTVGMKPAKDDRTGRSAADQDNNQFRPRAAKPLPAGVVFSGGNFASQNSRNTKIPVAIESTPFPIEELEFQPEPAGNPIQPAGNLIQPISNALPVAKHDDHFQEEPDPPIDDNSFVVLTAAQSSGPSQSTQGSTSYRLADQPKLGAHYKEESPLFDRNAAQVETEQAESLLADFSPDPIIQDYPYEAFPNQNIYQGKTLNANQRPLLELGRPWYQLGQLSAGSSILGFHNNVNPQLLVFGDYRQAIASNNFGGDSNSLMAFELNTIWNLFITSTERVVWGVAPFDNGAANTRWGFDNDRFEFETDFDFDFGYLEGDLGAIAGGFQNETLPFDAPFAIGLVPILIQNGVWLNDAVEGMFFTVPARNSRRFNISNMDVSFGFIWDEINSAAFSGDKNAAKAYLIYSFIEALNGYLEIDYAYLEDRTAFKRSYHNIGLAYTRRFGNFVSHSTRVIANAGQEVAAGDQTADGVLLLSENSLITRNPYTVVPYFNMFAGFDMPQTVAGDQKLVNTGILFESDGMTGYPTLDGRANDTYGGALGLNLLAQDFSQQLILEMAAVFRGNSTDLAGDQYGLGLRYQIPLSNSWIFRTDAMVGFFRGDEDASGARIELRKKF